MIETRRKPCKCGVDMEISLDLQDGKVVGTVFRNCYPVGDLRWNLKKSFDETSIWQVRCSICEGVRQVRTFTP